MPRKRREDRDRKGMSMKRKGKEDERREER